MRYLSISEVVRLHLAIVDASGGGKGIRDLGVLESCLAQPRSTFGGTELYPSLIEKAASLCFSLARNHPFIDGNKRIAHAAMETFLVLNGHEIRATVDEQEQLMLGLARSSVTREELVSWLGDHVVRRS
jgi:death on curing protein